MFAIDGEDYVKGIYRNLNHDIHLSVAEDYKNFFVERLKSLQNNKCLQIQCNMNFKNPRSIDNDSETYVIKRKFSVLEVCRMNIEIPIIRTGSSKVRILIGDKKITEIINQLTKTYLHGFREYEDFISCKSYNEGEIYFGVWPWNDDGIITFVN